MEERPITHRRNPKKSIAQSNSEKISEEYEYTKRFFVAVFDIVANNVEPNYDIFCKNNGIDAANLTRKIYKPQFSPKVEYFGILVNKYGYSAEWLLTGKGVMKP